MKIFGILATVAVGHVALVATAVHASTTINYEYDALGRLTAVKHTDGPNDQLTADYTYDRAGNRANVKVANSINGASNDSGSSAGVVTQKRFVVVPSGTGFALIFVN